MPIVAALTFMPYERVLSEGPGGAGYGDPLDRDPERVRLRAREGWISLTRARDIYGVVLDTSVEQYAVDHTETTRLRGQMRKERNKT
jgi:N-methylhydantoinase B